MTETKTLEEIYIHLYGTVKGTILCEKNKPILKKWLQEKRKEKICRVLKSRGALILTIGERTTINEFYRELLEELEPKEKQP